MSVRLEKNTKPGDTPRAERQVLLNNEMTRITQWRFQPGAETGWHRHTYDYVTVQQSGRRLQLERRDGSRLFVDYEYGRTVAYEAPIEHNATNVSDIDVQVLEIEYKAVIQSSLT